MLRYNFNYTNYHLVETSPYAIVIILVLPQINRLLLTNLSIEYYIITLVLLLTIIYYWLRDISIEANYLGYHTSKVTNGIYIGFCIFILSEIFIFISLFWTYLHSSLSPTVQIGCLWPPLGILAIDPYSLALFNTFILLLSSLLLTVAHQLLIVGDKYGALIHFLLTILSGYFFVLLQNYEYHTTFYDITDSVYGSIFYIATGLHGIHIIAGLVGIIIAASKLYIGSDTITHHLATKCSILYWHFVDILWLFIYTILYIWGYFPKR